KSLAVAVLAGVLTVSAAPLHAQAPPTRASAAQAPAAGPGAIRGVVVDGDAGTPIAAASVAVHGNAGSTLVAGAITGENGTFNIEGLAPGSYTVRITMLGYATLTTDALSLDAAKPRADLGQIRLVRQAIEVTGIEATAERQMIIAPDRNSYRARDVAPGAASASDVLENVPAVQVDADGKLSLRGNENVVVQINGRPTPMRGPQLAGYLRQLPANTVERIEVVPNPSAKQDPEGMAGIINIVMKQGVDLGTSVGL